MITNSFHEYKNDYASDNVYGHTVDLLKRNIDHNDKGLIHLDIGCGYGSIAEHISHLGRIYVGVDANQLGLASLASRGFETHRLVLSSLEENIHMLREIVGPRTVGSITLLDTLEHLPDSEAILGALYEISKAHNALLIVSVPNIAHRDVGFKLALGKINHTEAGLLDHTHVRMFDDNFLTETLRHSGFYITDRNDVRKAKSDQFFPSSHPVLQEGTTIRTFLNQLRSNVDDSGTINQIIVSCLPGEKISKVPFERPAPETRPFLTIVTRTQGKRIASLVELLTCLAGQTCTDFEVLIVGHNLSVDDQIAVEIIIEDLPTWLKDRVRLIRVEEGNRTRPLNAGFAAAKGEYIAIHDDDDIPLGHWVETFKAAAGKKYGCILRCVSVTQSIKTVNVNGKTAIRAVSQHNKPYPQAFNFLEHFRDNHSPNNTLAFPRGVYHELKIHFDEDLTTAEDWDFLMRTASIVGVASTEEITGIYQWSDQNSIAEHQQDEWIANAQRIQNKLNRQALLLAPGTFKQALSAMNGTSRPLARHEDLKLDSLLEQRQKLTEVADILSSRSWRITIPVRFLKRIFGVRSPTFRDYVNLPAEDLARIHADMKRSTSWRITAPLRRFKS
ncbi:Glycosyl transferase family 2 [Phyllobacterium sp. CL33Tsu]|nr:Glycosyl transferase family 2 [Phyllobacterium sp. CL33Tsu]